jgi:iron-sulfur cluster repair protein YtfE (RIC family)
MPLRRHPALRSLSRDHHLALQLARGLQTEASPLLRAQLPREKGALVAYVQRVFAEELAAHFDSEDVVLAPAVAGRAADLDRIVCDIESEHVEIFTLVAQLPDAAPDDAALQAMLDRLGHLLEDHVRREEREYYQRIQEVLDEASMQQLGAALGRHLVFHGRSAA